MTEEFEFVSNLLKAPISDEPENLIKDLEAIEVWNARMQFLLAEANSMLDIKSFEALPAKEGKSELDRKLQLESHVAFLRMERDKIEGLVDAIKTRITLGQSILKYYSSTQSIQYKETKQNKTLDNDSPF